LAISKRVEGAAAQRYIEIARESGMIIEEVFTHDHFPTSPLSDGDFTSATPDKTKRMAQLEMYLIFFSTELFYVLN